MTYTVLGWSSDMLCRPLQSPVDAHIIIQGFQTYNPFEVLPTHLLIHHLVSWDYIFCTKLCTAWLLTNETSLTSATTKQWSVSQSPSLKYQTSSILNYPLYEDVINLLVCSSWQKSKCIYKYSVVGILSPDSSFLGVAVFHTLIALIVLATCEVSFPVVNLKISLHTRAANCENIGQGMCLSKTSLNSLLESSSMSGRFQNSLCNS